MTRLVLLFLLLAAVPHMATSGGKEDGADMEEDELKGLYMVMGALLEDPSWPDLHPRPCTDTPWPGIQCELPQAQQPANQGRAQQLQDPYLHVTRLHIGPDVASPPCRAGAVMPVAALLKLSYLKSLSLFSCFTTGPPVTLSADLFTPSSHLEQLVLKSNPGLAGGIPATIALVSGLRVLSLSQNRFQAEIPRELGGGGLARLEQLDLSYNRLSGRIPEDLSGLRSLSILDLSWNSLQGRLPPSLGQLAGLQKVDLSGNMLSGAIPEEMGSLGQLVLLDLSRNSLLGPIPATFCRLNGSLEYLLLEGNRLGGLIPPFLGDLRRLSVLGLSGCGLSGPIPSSLGGLSRLAALSLDRNRLNGTVPPELGQLPGLRQLNLSQNALTGEVGFGEEFVARLGSRLDVRSNKGLCTDPAAYRRNVALMNSVAPPCSWPSAAAGTGSVDGGSVDGTCGGPGCTVGASRRSWNRDTDEGRQGRSSVMGVRTGVPAVLLLLLLLLITTTSCDFL